jgi:hypothetical protein
MRSTVAKLLNLSLIFGATSFLGAASCEAPEHPWDKDIYVYQFSMQMMRNLKDPAKDTTAETANGWVCTPKTVYQNVIMDYVIRTETALKKCQEEHQ